MLALVVDTNLFHEFRRLQDLPWEDLGETGEVVLVVTEPVQSELDEHKKSTKTRLKRRALEWTKQFRRLILDGQTDLIVRGSDPRVVVRLDGTRPDTRNDDVLDRSIADDSIVAIALALRSTYEDATLAVFSDDLRPLRKARQVALDVIEIPEQWRREPEQTEEDKAQALLERQVAELRHQEPTLVLSTIIETPIEKVLPVYAPLSNEELDRLINDVRLHHPIETNFEQAKRQIQSALHSVSFGFGRREFHPASQEDITRYMEEGYPNWIENCRKLLGECHSFLGLVNYGLRLPVELANQGTRPALDLQVSFRVNGSIGIIPDYEDEALRFMGHVAPPFDLPKAPSAPQGEWRTYDPMASIRGLHDRGFDDLSPYRGTSLQDVLRDQRRDPNKFYYRDKPHEPVSSYSLTCEQFRQADEVENFDILMRPSGDIHALDGKNAVVEVIANASNLTSPETLKIPIRFQCEPRSTYDAVRDRIFPESFSLDGFSGSNE